jgi:hypothetical protein
MEKTVRQRLDALDQTSVNVRCAELSSMVYSEFVQNKEINSDRIMNILFNTLQEKFTYDELLLLASIYILETTKTGITRMAEDINKKVNGNIR